MAKRALAKMFLEKGIITAKNFKSPILLRCKKWSPMYCDMRMCTSHPDLMRTIKSMYTARYHVSGIDCVVGVATGGLMHAQNIAEGMNLPSGYIRTEVKAHGKGKVIEGLEDVLGKVVLLVEDVVTTGESVLRNYDILMKAGAKKVIVTCLFTYNFNEAKEAFDKAGTVLDSLIDINDVMPEMEAKIGNMDYLSLEEWVDDPDAWFEHNKITFDLGFLTYLRRTAAQTKSRICMGLDPVIEALPEIYRKEGIVGYGKFIKDLINYMHKRGVSPGAYKMNHGFYEAYDNPLKKNFAGSAVLADLMLLVGQTAPTILDFKRGDIGKSSANYAKVGFENWGADSVTIAPYMGTDSAEPFTKYCNINSPKGAWVLCKTSNPGSKDLQTLKVGDERKYLYEMTAALIIKWAENHPGVGAVAGGNSIAELSHIARLFAGKNIPLLIPGVGSQGGTVPEVVEALLNAHFELDLALINLSSGLTHPWYKDASSVIPSPEECFEIVVNTLIELNKQVDEAKAKFFIAVAAV